MPGINPPQRIFLTEMIYKSTTDQFVIPIYQRNYTWDAKVQVKKFLSDLDSVLSGEKSAHFLGIIMYLQINVGFGENELSIVDGQQRLVTTFLILQCLRELEVENKQSEKADKIYHNYLMCHDSNPGEKPRLRLKPLVADDDVYRKILENKTKNLDTAEKKSRVYTNYKYIKDEIRKMLIKHTAEDVIDALNKMYLVVIPLDATDDAQQIFETINSAGDKLKETDLIRNYILMNLQSDIQEKYYTDYWKPLEQLFDKTDKFVLYIRYYLSAKQYRLIDKDDIYSEFQSWWQSTVTDDASAKEALSSLFEYGRYYITIFSKDVIGLDKKIEDKLVEFRKTPAEPTAPLLIEFMALYKQDLIPAESVSKIIELVISYLVRRSLLGLQTGAFTRDIPLILKDVMNACNGNYDNVYEFLVKFLVANTKQKKIFMPDDSNIKISLQSANAYAIGKYLKTAFEKIEMEDNKAPIDFNNLTIEHIMPQTSTEYWRVASETASDEEYSALINRIGNLTFAIKNDNSKMGNKNWDDKKIILNKTAHIKMNNELLKLEKWDRKCIDERTNGLIAKIIELYPYPSIKEDALSGYKVHLHSDNNDATATIYSDGKITVEEGSTFDIQDVLSYKEIDALASEEYVDYSDGILKVIKDITFENLEELQKAIFDDCEVNPWEKWTTDEGKPLSITIREFIHY